MDYELVLVTVVYRLPEHVAPFLEPCFSPIPAHHQKRQKKKNINKKKPDYFPSTTRYILKTIMMSSYRGGIWCGTNYITNRVATVHNFCLF